jgi:hypothetical protein
LEGIRNYLGAVSQYRWRKEIDARGLTGKLRVCLLEAYQLHIIDSIQYRDWTAEYPWQFYDLTRLGYEGSVKNLCPAY